MNQILVCLNISVIPPETSIEEITSSTENYI
jgi:hypothetical protein